MIGIAELVIVIGVLALGGTYMGIVHRLLRGADGPKGQVTQPRVRHQTHSDESAP